MYFPIVLVREGTRELPTYGSGWPDNALQWIINSDHCRDCRCPHALLNASRFQR